jgi:hypothetical protein
VVGGGAHKEGNHSIPQVDQATMTGESHAFHHLLNSASVVYSLFSR